MTDSTAPDQDDVEFDLDALENEFFEQYMSPEGELEQDPDTFDYQWPVTEWATKDAVRSIFEDRLTEEQITEVADDLDLTSTSWMSIEEYRAANSDTELDDAFGDFDDAEDGEDD